MANKSTELTKEIKNICKAFNTKLLQNVAAGADYYAVDVLLDICKVYEAPIIGAEKQDLKKVEEWLLKNPNSWKIRKSSNDEMLDKSKGLEKG